MGRYENSGAEQKAKIAPTQPPDSPKGNKTKWRYNGMDTRKLDMVFFMTLENGKDLTFKEIEEIANKYSARSLWYLWRHTQRYRKYINK